MNPMQRFAGLVTSEVGEDLVIFDTSRHHLHTIPAPIATVWHTCDGSRAVADIAVMTRLSSNQVEAALVQLGEAGLLEGPVPTAPSGRDRRWLLKKAALGAAIVSVTAPLAAQASSAWPAEVPTSQMQRGFQGDFSTGGESTQAYGFSPPCEWGTDVNPDNHPFNATETQYSYYQQPWFCTKSTLTCNTSPAGQVVPLSPWSCQNVG